MSIRRLFVMGLDGVDISIAKEQNLLLDNTIAWDLVSYPKKHTLRIWLIMYLGRLFHKDPKLPDPIAYHTSDEESFFRERANWFRFHMRVLSKFSHLLSPSAVRSRKEKFLEEQGLATPEPRKNDWSDTIFDNVVSKTINLSVSDPFKVQLELKHGWRTQIESEDAGLENLDVLTDKERNAVRAEHEKALAGGTT